MRIFLVAAERVSSSWLSASRINFGARGITLSLSLDEAWMAVEILYLHEGNPKIAVFFAR
jgi:hypothetical protein